MYKSLYEDTDSVKCVTELTAEERKLLKKCILNSQYGTMITSYKENNMRMKDFIVLHSKGQPALVKKEAITLIAKKSDGTTEMVADSNKWIIDDKYDDVIKRLFDI